MLNRRHFSLALSAAGLSACAIRPSAERADAVVIGAGLAGLAAADALAAAGMQVRVVEASARIGGRAYTARDLPDRGEYGGIQVGDTYAGLRSLAARYNVALGRFPHAFPRPVLALGETLINAPDWASASANTLPSAERALPPSRLLDHFLAAANPLNDLLDWMDPRFADADVSIASVLAAAGASMEARRLIAVNANYNDLATSSAVNVWRGQVLRKTARSADVITAGTDTLARAVAAALTPGVTLKTAVGAVRKNGTRYDVLATNGARYRADHVVVATPPNPTAAIEFDVDGGDDRRTALRALPYTAISLVFIDTPAFWQRDGLPAHLWTDGPFERWFPRIDAKSGEIVGFKIWLNGPGALAADGMTDSALMDAIRTTLRTLRPASDGAATLARRLSWQTDVAFQNGAYPEWPAGQTARLANALRAPLGRVHFAGDYTSERITGLEGAVESGARAARDILLGA